MSGHFIAKCPYTSDKDRDKDKKGKKMEKKRYYNKKKGGEAHMGREWDSNESSTDSSSDEDATNIAINKGLLFPNVGHVTPQVLPRAGFLMTHMPMITCG
jgi:hypothetical protein